MNEKLGPAFSIVAKEYFDGGTYWNGHRQTYLASDDGFTSQMLSEVATSIDQVFIEAAMCCWTQDR